jgi:PAS domain S-box-containing protein
MVHPNDISHIQDAYTRCLSDESHEYKCEFLLRNAQGEYQTILSRGILTQDESGRGRYLVGSHTDITSLHTHNEEARRLFKRYELIFKSIPHLIVVKDGEGNFLFVNQALANFYGEKDPSRMIGKRDADYNKNSKQVENFIRMDRQVIERRKSQVIAKEQNTDHRRRNHWLTTIKVPLINEDGTVHVVVVATFLDDVMRLQDKIKKHEERGALAKKLNHKLGTRIFTLQNLSSVIALNDEDRNEINAAIEDIKEFSDDFVRLSVANKPTKKQTNLFAILNRALRPIASEAQIMIDGRKFQSRLKSKPEFTLYADEPKLVDLFSELAKNSLKWRKSSSNHIITVSIHAIYEESNSISNVPVSRRFPIRFKIIFEDNGKGIKDNVRPEIFDLFVSGNPQGTGLGLSIAREVLEAHGGSIRETSKGGGARFEIILPTSTSEQH